MPPFSGTLTMTSLSGTTISPPLLTSWSPTRTELFHLGTNLGTYHKWRNGASSTPFKPSTTSWEKIGEKAQISLTGTCWGEDRVDLFGVGADGNTLDHKWYDGEWHNWETLKPAMMGSGEVVQPRVLGEVAAYTLKKKGLINVVWRGMDGGLWFMHWREDKGMWMQVRLTKEGAWVFLGSPRVVAWTEDVEVKGPEGKVDVKERWRVDVFGRVVGGRVMHAHWNEDQLGPVGGEVNTWVEWKDVGGGQMPILDDPEVVQWQTKNKAGEFVYHMNLFARDAMGNVVRKRWSSEDGEEKWTPEENWELTGVQGLTPPSAMAWNMDKIGNVTVAVLDTQNNLRVAKQDGSEWWQGAESWKNFEATRATPFIHRPVLHPNGGPMNEANPLEIFLVAEDASVNQVMVKWKDM